MASITPQGFVLKTQNEYFDQIVALFQAIDPEWSLEVSTPDGQKTAVDAEILGNLDEVALQAYNARDLDAATGLALTILGRLFGIDRQVATPSTSSVTVTGTSGTVIPQASIVTSSFDQSNWVTDTAVTIGPTGNATIAITAQEPGARTASPNTITQISTPVGGWSTVTNPAAAVIGSDVETDAQLRQRIRRSRAALGDNQIDTLMAAIGNVDNVTHIRIYENFESTTDANGLDGHSYAVFVQGGVNDVIASEMARYKNPGTGQNRTNVSLGTPIVIETLTPRGRPFSAVFFRPTAVTIHMTVNVTQIGSLPTDIEDQIKAEIIRYVNSELFVGENVTGFNRNGFDIGEDVPPGRFYTPVNKVLGQGGENDSYVTSILVGETNGGQTANPVVIDFNELATFAEANITVNVTIP